MLEIKVGAHGTGAGIPPVDEQVVAMKLATPSFGTLELSDRQNPAIFRMAKVRTAGTSNQELSKSCDRKNRRVGPFFNCILRSLVWGHLNEVLTARSGTADESLRQSVLKRYPREPASNVPDGLGFCPSSLSLYVDPATRQHG